MMRRILMALLIMCLAAPAVAMPLEQAVSTKAASADCHGGMPVQDRQDHRNTADHGCIGCLAPFRHSVNAAQPLVISVLPPVPALTAQRPDANTAPEPPPPRA